MIDDDVVTLRRAAQRVACAALGDLGVEVRRWSGGLRPDLPDVPATFPDYAASLAADTEAPAGMPLGLKKTGADLGGRRLTKPPRLLFATRPPRPAHNNGPPTADDSRLFQPVVLQPQMALTRCRRTRRCSPRKARRRLQLCAPAVQTCPLLGPRL